MFNEFKTSLKNYGSRVKQVYIDDIKSGAFVGGGVLLTAAIVATTIAVPPSIIAVPALFAGIYIGRFSGRAVVRAYKKHHQSSKNLQSTKKDAPVTHPQNTTPAKSNLANASVGQRFNAAVSNNEIIRQPVETKLIVAAPAPKAA